MGAARSLINRTPTPLRMLPTRRILVPALAAFAAIVLAGCASDLEQRGNLPDPDQVAGIHPGSTTKAEVVKLLGSPSSVSVFDGNSWYYISKRTQQVAFLDPDVLDQQVFVVNFTKAGVVKNIEHKGLKDGEDIAMVPGETPAPGRHLSFLEQFIGNIGRFNSAGPAK
jgi:outer membrane protein assembly factor BamE (lipoprotein component of BamABCDE complex)